MDVAGKWVWITGAAGGLGAAMALNLADRGANLVLTDLVVEIDEPHRELAAFVRAPSASDLYVYEPLDRVEARRKLKPFQPPYKEARCFSESLEFR